MTVINERFVQFAEKLNERFNERCSEIIAEIVVDTADELPEADGISGKILHQGSVALISKEDRVAVLSGDGHWYADKEMIK